MSRPLRIEYPGAWYHIMNRGHREDSIFEDNKDREIFISLLKESANLWNVHISAFCLMNNYYHILAQTPQGNLSRFMRHLNGVYTQRYNRFHENDGQLFRGRYKSILIEEDSHLLGLIRYIHRNPVRAGIVNSSDQYPWSSHQGFLSAAAKWNWLYKDFILSMLATKKKKQKRSYREFMTEEESHELLNLFERKKWPAILGCDDFVLWVKETFLQKKKNRQIPESLQLPPERTRIIKEVCRIYMVDKNNLLTVRRGNINEPRDIAIYLCRILRNDTLKEIGKTFNMTGYSPAGSAVNRVRKKLLQDKKLKHQVEYITNSILWNNDVLK